MADKESCPDTPLVCELCKDEVLDNETYIVSRCGGNNCENDIKCHQGCVERFLTKQVGVTTQSAAASKYQNKVTHAPHAALKAQPCPREGCNGRVQDAERVTQTKRKKELEAALAAPPSIPVPAPKPTGRGRKAHKAPAAAQVAATPATHSPSPPPPVRRQKAQPNVPAKDELRQQKGTSALAQMPSRVRANRNLNRYNALATLPEEGEEEGEEAASVVSHTPTEDEGWGPSLEEIDAAVREGVLSEDYRTDWCKDHFDKQRCPRGVNCPFAHNLQQLRIDAAIKKGTVREDFKLNFCADEHQKGRCGYGIRCQHAHSAEQLRILKLMDLDLLDDTYHTEFCNEFLRTGNCRAGIACSDAHSRAEFRAEAAVLHGNKHYTLRFSLCQNFYRNNQCPKGILCDQAHGIDEVRLCSAVHYNELTPHYKTRRCIKETCDTPWRCHYFHTEKDRRRRISRKTAYCPIFQELGSCGVGNKCFWAHGTADLDTKAFCFDFPSVNAQSGNWDRVGKKPAAVKTGKQSTWQSGAGVASSSGVAWGGGAWSGGQHARGSPSAGHQAAFRPKQTAPEQPLAVQLHKMPIQPEMGRKRKKKTHRTRGPGANHFKLCHEFQLKGHCTAVDCGFAHGRDVLDARHQEREGVLNGPAQRQKALNPVTAKLGDAALFQLKKHKLDACTAELKCMGLMQHEAQDAARLWGGDLESASDWHLEQHLRARPKHNAEVSVSGEAASVLQAAYEKGWSLQLLEQQIKVKGGDYTALFPEQATGEEAASSSSSLYSPRSEASSWETGTPRTPWQEAAAAQLDQAVAKGQTVTYDKDGFPDLSCLDLENNQEALRYEGIVAAANERRQNQRESRQQPASSSAARTPFASGRPQHDDRYVDHDAAAVRSSQSLAAMGVGPSTNGFGLGPSRAAQQSQGSSFATMTPQGSLPPPPPYQGPRNPPHNPPPDVNIYGQPLPPEPARSAFGHAVNDSHPAQSASDSFQNGFHQDGHANGIPSYQPAQQAQHDYSSPQTVPQAGNWQKQLWAADAHRPNADFAWVQQQRQQQNAVASSGFRGSAQQLPQEYEQMPAISAQHPAPKQHAHTAATAKPSLLAPAEFDLDGWINDAFNDR